MMAVKSVLVRIEGQVQGVWFRAWMMDEATKKGLAGWVRNRRDGSVEALFSGKAEVVDTMIAACRQGPSRAQVSNVRVETAEPFQGSGFGKRPTV
jgi:acylphosphatase